MLQTEANGDSTSESNSEHNDPENRTQFETSPSSPVLVVVKIVGSCVCVLELSLRVPRLIPPGTRHQAAFKKVFVK